MKEAKTLVEYCDIYLGLLNPFYSKKINYWKKQRAYAQMIVDKGWDPSPTQISIFRSNIDELQRSIDLELKKG